MYGQLAPAYPETLDWVGGMLGQDILRGKHLHQGGIPPSDWLHVVLALLCHDIGYGRGLGRKDGGGAYTTGGSNQHVVLPPGSTDAALTPYHVDRRQRFIRERFGNHARLDAERMATPLLSIVQAVIAQLARDTGGPTLVLQLLVYAAVDATLNFPTKQKRRFSGQSTKPPPNPQRAA